MKTHEVITCQVFTRYQHSADINKISPTIKLLFICPYKLMHFATWVLTCLPPILMEERRHYLYLSTILWDNKPARLLSNLVDCKVTLSCMSIPCRCCHGNSCQVLPKSYSAPTCVGVWNAKNPQKSEADTEFSKRGGGLSQVQIFRSGHVIRSQTKYQSDIS